MSNKSKFTDLNKYKILYSIGEGSFGDVFLIKNKKTHIKYAAKVAKFMVDECTEDEDITHKLFREVNLFSLLNHPSILKFVGYSQINFEKDPNPTIITEYATNGSLKSIIEMEKSGIPPNEWNDTKKLIIIYGIASGMSYMHKNNVIHRDLKPENILVDDYLYPKISDFGISKIYDALSTSMNIQSQAGIKGTPIYCAPEIYANEIYSKASDVYAFAFIVFEIITLKKPFQKYNFYQIMKAILKGERPHIPEDTPDVYRELIERGWSQDPKDRPSFDDIVDELKNDERYINDLINVTEFYDYVDFIDESESTFDKSKQLLHFNDFIKIQGRNKNIEKVKLNKEDNYSDESETEYESNLNEEYEIEEQEYLTEMESTQETIDINTSNNTDESMKINEINDECTFQIPQDYNLSYPFTEFTNLSTQCQLIIKEAENNPLKQLLVSHSLLNGENQFPINIILGIQYLDKSIKNKCFESIIYYIKLLIKGKIGPKNLNKAKKILNNYQNIKDSRLLVLKGKISNKEKKYSEAMKYFENGLKNEDRECIFEYAKNLFLGRGIKKNVKKAFELFKSSSNKGFRKSTNFLNVYQQMIEINEFKNLNSETQFFFVSNSIKNINKSNDNIFNKIVISPNKTEMLFYNNSLKSIDFYIFLSIFKEILIEIQFPSETFKTLLDYISKFRDIHVKQLNIGIVITSFPQDISYVFQNQNISHYRIDSSIRILPSFCFKKCTLMTNISIPPSVSIIKNSAFVDCSSLTQIDLPTSVTSIEEGAFDSCICLERISLPFSLTSIGKFAFNECTQLKSITIPHSVVLIGDYAFNGCASLSHVTVPSSVTSIGEFAFSGCSSLTKIFLPSSIASIKDWTFRGCSSLKQVLIPSSVASIGCHAFEGCSSLKEMSIPSSVTSIPSFAFRGCTSLTKITIPSSVASIMNSAFNGCSSLRHVSIPTSLKTIKSSLFAGCSNLIQISIPSSVTAIESNAFDECAALKTISIPSSVQSIGDYAFRKCFSLSQISIPSSVKSVGENAFIECCSLKQITIPSCINEKTLGIDSKVVIKKI